MYLIVVVHVTLFIRLDKSDRPVQIIRYIEYYVIELVRNISGYNKEV